MSSHMVLSSHVAMFAGIPCMWHTVSQCLWCFYSYVSNILTPVRRTLSFLYYASQCRSAVEFISTIERELLSFCPSCECHQSLPVCFILASSVSYFVTILCVATPVSCMISACVGGHLHMLPHVCPLWMYILFFYWCGDDIMSVSS